MWRPSWIFRPGNGSPSATNVVLVVISTKAFSFHNQSLSNFAYTLATALSTIPLCRIFKLSRNKLTIMSTIPLCRIFKLSRNQLTIINFNHQLCPGSRNQQQQRWGVHDCRHGPGVYKLGLVTGQHVEISQYRRHRYYRTFPGPTATHGCSYFHKNDNQILK